MRQMAKRDESERWCGCACAKALVQQASGQITNAFGVKVANVHVASEFIQRTHICAAALMYDTDGPLSVSLNCYNFPFFTQFSLSSNAFAFYCFSCNAHSISLMSVCHRSAPLRWRTSICYCCCCYFLFLLLKCVKNRDRVVFLVAPQQCRSRNVAVRQLQIAVWHADATLARAFQAVARAADEQLISAKLNINSLLKTNNLLLLLPHFVAIRI